MNKRTTLALLLGAASVPVENGLFVWDGALDFDNVNGTAPGPGFFPNNYDLALFGISQGAPPSAYFCHR